MLNEAKPTLRLGDFCYYILGIVTDRKDGLWGPVLVVRGESGYYPMPWAWGRTRAEAEEACRDQNHRLGITPEEQSRIVASSMASQNRRFHRTRVTPTKRHTGGS